LKRSFRTARRPAEAPPAAKKLLPSGSAPYRWAAAGIVLGALLATARFAPASWAAQALEGSFDGRLTLADVQGTVWDGSALPMLSAAGGSREAMVLPSRLEWSLRPAVSGMRLTLSQACCLPQPMQWLLVPGIKQASITLAGPLSGVLLQWPAQWLVGLGAPWNTLKPGGLVQLSSPGLSLRLLQGRWRFDGQAQVDLLNLSSAISPLDRLGSYRLVLAGRAEAGDAMALTLNTLDGALQLTGSGQSTPAGLRFRGEARAAPGQEGPLNNLLNIIGRRTGAATAISIG
jgi:general secretion pathway protein N